MSEPNHTAADVIAGAAPWAVEHADALDWLAGLPEGCLSMCCTSPPYFALRKYSGVEPRDWPAVEYAPMPGLPAVSVPTMTSCLGLEGDPSAWVGHLVLIFRALWRAMRQGGTLWLNCGDSYANNGACGGGSPVDQRRYGRGGATPAGRPSDREAQQGRRVPPGLKPKDLLGTPWRLAFALQADGWHLRSAVTWAKSSPMPESVRDRPTRATEMLFLLTKGAAYSYDQESCRQAQSPTSHGGNPSAGGAKWQPERHDNGTLGPVAGPAGRNLWDWWDLDELPPDPLDDLDPLLVLGPEPSRAKHYAPFPSEVPRRAVKLGTPARGVCPRCGAPWVRVVESRQEAKCRNVNPRRYAGGADGEIAGKWTAAYPEQTRRITTTAGWRPACPCYGVEVIGDRPAEPRRGRGEAEADWAQRVADHARRDTRWLLDWTRLRPVYDGLSTAPALCCDPFLGSGTTLAVCRELGRRFVGCDASLEFVEMARKRGAAVAPLADACDTAAAKREAVERRGCPGLFDREDTP
jgi:hypothetical protein